MRNLLTATATVALLAIGTAHATTIAAGQTVTASQVQLGSLTVVGGTGSGSIAFTSQPPAGQASTFSGNYVEQVFRDDGNKLCGVSGQCLTFVIEVTNSSSSADSIKTVSSGPFSDAFAYNVGYSSNTGGVAPLTISDSSTGTISFNFTTPANPSMNALRPGQSSDYLVIQSSATSFTRGLLSFQDSQTATVAGFIPLATPPASAVPEPASLAVLGLGMAGVAAVRRRRAA